MYYLSYIVNFNVKKYLLKIEIDFLENHKNKYLNLKLLHKLLKYNRIIEDISQSYFSLDSLKNIIIKMSEFKKVAEKGNFSKK